jgi:hypothetical protein
MRELSEMKRFLCDVAFRVLLALLIFDITVASAATTPNSFVSPQTPNRGILQFTSSSSAGTYATLYTAGANGSRCYAAWINNNDPSATHLVTLQVVNSTTKYGGTALTTVESAGFTSGNPPQNLLTSAVWPGLPVDAYGNPYIQLISGDTLQATFATSITSSDVVNLFAVCSDF